MYFENCGTLEQLKAEYKRLAMMYHPDRGGDLRTMQAINSEYDSKFKQVKDCHINKDGKTYSKETSEKSSEFVELINQLIRMKGIAIEIIGCFVWVSGDTKPHKDGLKKLGFKWHRVKACWYKSPQGYRRFSNKKEYTFDEIRAMYGSMTVNTKPMQELTV